jgi:glycosyltransferase involved in cell wall biosynthesis
MSERCIKTKCKVPSDTKRQLLRLLYLAPQPFYEDRGTPIVILEELKCLSELGYAIDVLTYPLGKNINLKGVTYIRVSNIFNFKNVPIGFSKQKMLLDALMLLKAFSLVKHHRYDCVHGVEESAIICMFLKLLFRIPMIYDMHSSLPEQLSNVFFFQKGPGNHVVHLFERWLIRNADVILASKGLKPLISAIDPESDIREWIFGSNQSSNESKYLDLGIDGRPTVAYVGNFASYQGIDLLIKAILKVRDEIRNIVLLLVGGTINEISVITNMVSSYDLNENVIVVPRVPREHVSNYLSIADVLALPRPRGENAPLKIYEYEKSGKPIVATNIPAHGLISNSVKSIMVRPNVNVLARGIIKALRDADQSSSKCDSNFHESDTSTTKTLKETIKEVYQKFAAGL